MKKCLLIVLIIVGVIIPCTMISQAPAYVDDAYYWPTVDTTVIYEPVYDKNAQELIFFPDTAQYPDTVKMRIIQR